MGIINIFNFTTDTEQVTRTKLNNLVTNLLNEFNGNIENVNVKAAAGIIGSKLDLSAPGVIGGTTPAAGTFTDIAIGGEAHFGTEVDNGDSGATDTIDWTAGNKQKSTLTDNVTYTFTNPSGACSLILKVIQDAGGTNTVTWDGDVQWAGGNAPTITVTGNAVDIVAFYYDGNGNYYGSIIQDVS